MQFCVFDTEKGWTGIAFTATGLCRLVLPQREYLEVREELLATARSDWHEVEEHPYIAEVQRYLAGELKDLALPVDWSWATPFQREVLELVKQIPYGRTETYGSIAAKLGKPHAMRAVGGALGRNQVPLVIPCHRVLAAGQKLGGFSSRHGLKDKIGLLRLEGIEFSH